MAQSRVVLVTNDDWIAQLLSAPLREEGAEVVCCAHAQEALDLANSVKQDAVLCDAVLADHDAAWLVGRLREGPHPTTLFVVLAHADDSFSRMDALQAGADACLTKPFKVDEVCMQLQALIAMARRINAKAAELTPPPPSTPLPPSRAPGEDVLAGDLAQLSLSTVLSMLEIERRTGVLTVKGAKQVATVVLQGGAATKASLGGVEMAPVPVVRRVLRWKTGRFTFRSADSLLPPSDQISIVELLMEAARLEDENASHGPSSPGISIGPPSFATPPPAAGRPASRQGPLDPSLADIPEPPTAPAQERPGAYALAEARTGALPVDNVAKPAAAPAKPSPQPTASLGKHPAEPAAAAGKAPAEPAAATGKQQAAPGPSAGKPAAAKPVPAAKPEARARPESPKSDETPTIAPGGPAPTGPARPAAAVASPPKPPPPRPPSASSPGVLKPPVALAPSAPRALEAAEAVAAAAAGNQPAAVAASPAKPPQAAPAKAKEPSPSPIESIDVFFDELEAPTTTGSASGEHVLAEGRSFTGGDEDAHTRNTRPAPPPAENLPPVKPPPAPSVPKIELPGPPRPAQKPGGFRPPSPPKR